MRAASYPTYKDSGTEWLGQIPAHWEARRLKCVASINLSNVDKKTEDGQEPVQLCNYVDVYKNEYIAPNMDFMAASATGEQIRRFALQAGDVLITKDSESWDDIAVPACVVEDMPHVLCGYHLALIRPDRDRSVGRYLARAFASVGLRDQFWVSANGITRYGLTGDAISTGTLPAPPRDEQQTIAGFLDRETAKIDSLVEKKERLIELLQEKRTALITHAVTKGLDPAVPMKDSGIEWLGQIPEHWAGKRLRFISPHITVGIVVEPSKYYEDTGVPCLRSLNVRPNQLLNRDLVYISPESHHLLAKSEVRKGDLVAVRSGQPGTTAVVDDRFHGANCIDLIIIREPAQGNSTFFSYFLNSLPAQAQFIGGAGGAIQQHFNIGTASDLWLVEPPFNEQSMIANFLDRETARIDALIAKVGEAIERLKEYRTALISAAVTGKIDVREEVESDRP